MHNNIKYHSCVAEKLNEIYNTSVFHRNTCEKRKVT